MPASLLDTIQKHTTDSSLPKGSSGETLSINAISTIAKEHKIPGYLVEIEALKNSIYPTRYLRNMEGITRTNQIKLLESSIALIGLGGLGGNLLEMFIRTGIGRIRIADGDKFEESNLNRQALSTTKNLGLPKSEAAFERANQINPSVKIEAHNSFLAPHNLPEFLTNCDIAIDALGGLKTRLALQKATAKVNIPLVTGALAGWTGYVSVVLPDQTGPAEIMGQDNTAEEILGCPAPTIAFIASLMATETIKILSGFHSLIAGKMLIIDLHSLTFETIAL